MRKFILTALATVMFILLFACNSADIDTKTADVLKWTDISDFYKIGD